MAMTKDMTSGNPTSLILKFSIPMLIGNLFQQFYNMVDSIVVGKYVGKEALAAVGTCGPPNFFIFSLALGLAAGVSIVISQYYGAKDYERVRKSFATAIYIIIVAAIIMGIIGFIFAKPILTLLNTPINIIDQATVYMKISCLGFIGVACYNGMASVLRALGDSITPLIFLIIASVLNVILDLVFVINFQMGVPGVAIATIISQIVSAIGCITLAMIKVNILRMPIKQIKPSKEIFIKCIKLGLPVAIQNSFISLSTMLLQGVINSYGETVMAAATAAARVEQLILQPGMSIGVAVATFTGQNIGAGKIERVKKGFWAASKIIIIFSLFMLPCIYFGGNAIMKLFTNAKDVEVARIGMEAMRVTCFFYSFVGMIFVSRNLLSGAGDMKIPMIMGFVEVVCRVAFAAILSSTALEYQGIWWATGLTWLFTSFFGIARYSTGKWRFKSVVSQN